MGKIVTLTKPLQAYEHQTSQPYGFYPKGARLEIVEDQGEWVLVKSNLPPARIK